MSDLRDGEAVEVQGSASRPYVLKNVGGVYSCSCPAWRNQSLPIERRTCKHLRKLLGDAAEEVRVGSALPARAQASDGPKAAPPLLLAESWDRITDPEGWWLSEKLDGVRAYFDGRRFLSRQGNVYHAPDWFLAGLPPVPLDGELWLGRKKFQRAVSIVRRQDQTDLWQEIAFLVFDAPALAEPFEQRLRFLADLLQQQRPPFARVHEHVRCRGRAHLEEELARVEAAGGEGLMLREPGSHYVVGRSPTLLKVKRFQDAEARVVGHQPGAGRHRGRLGALLAELANGVRFAVGTGLSDAERASPPPVGSVITFRYQELTEAGVPRFPSYIGLRDDHSLSPEKGGVPMSTAKGTARRFEYVEGTSSKFWEIRVDGRETVVQFGRIGTAGQANTKTFPDEAAAAKFAEKMIKEKLTKGYQEVR